MVTRQPVTTLVKQDGVYRQADARLLVAANDNMTAPLCRQTYEVERALARWKEAA